MNFNDRTASIDSLSVPMVLDHIKNMVENHSYNPLRDCGKITFRNGNTFTLEIDNGSEEKGTAPHIGLFNDMRAMAFFSLGELIGYIRGINENSRG